MGVMCYPLEHLLMYAAAITANREAENESSGFPWSATATLQRF